jgi:hypothetical protein
MTEACDGREVVGMDLHRRRSVLVRMTADGRARCRSCQAARFHPMDIRRLRPQ